jgi:hypothetical protein
MQQPMEGLEDDHSIGCSENRQSTSTTKQPTWNKPPRDNKITSDHHIFDARACRKRRKEQQEQISGFLGERFLEKMA